MPQHPIRCVLEAALLCSEQPLSLKALVRLFETDESQASVPDEATIQQHLKALEHDWHDRGLELAKVAGGWQFQSRPHMQVYLDRLESRRPPRYSRALMETLAIIAWHQPVTRGDIEDIRGVSVSSPIIRTLQERGWIETLGHRDAPGRPALLGTTQKFLSDLGLRALDELPPIANFDSGDPAVAPSSHKPDNNKDDWSVPNNEDNLSAPI